MNPEPGKQASEATAAVDPDVLRQIVDEMEQANPYGFGKFTDDDATILGLPSLGSLRLAHKLCAQLIGTPFMPKWIRESQNPTGTFVATVIRGQELGFKMLEGVQSLYLSPDGRLGMYGTAMLALMRKSKITIKLTEIEDGYTAYGKRPDGDDFTATFTTADAKRAGLVKGGGAHEKYPITMCMWRAASMLFRALASDLTGGPVYTAEELVEEVIEETIRRETEKQATERSNPYMANGVKPADNEPPPVPKSNVTEMPKQPEPEKPAAPKEPAKTEPTKSPDPDPVAAASDIPTAEEVMKEPEPAKTEPAKTAAPKAESAKTAQPNITEAVAAVVEKIPDLSPDSAKAKVVEFLRGFTGMPLKAGVKVSPEDQKKIMAAMPWVDAALAKKRKEFLADPHSLGVKVGAGWKKLHTYLQEGEHSWPEDVVKAVTKIAKENYAGSGGGDFLEYLQDIIHVDGDKENNLEPFNDNDMRAAVWIFQGTVGTPHQGILLRCKSLADLKGLGLTQFCDKWFERNPNVDPNTVTAEWFAAQLDPPAPKPEPEAVEEEMTL